MVTYIGYIETVLDALLILEGCRIGILSRAMRRPTGREQTSIQSGAVYVWDEDETGIQRWTDGRRWSSSRPRGNFIIYRELRGPPLSESPNAETDTDTATDESLKPSTAPFDMPPTLEKSSDLPDHLQTVLTSSGRRLWAKAGGLTKRALSIKIADGRRLHLVSYYSARDVLSNKLKIPRFDPFVKNIIIPRSLYPELVCDVGPDEQKTWRFAMAQGRGRAEVIVRPRTNPQIVPHRISTDSPTEVGYGNNMDAPNDLNSVANPIREGEMQPISRPHAPLYLTNTTSKFPEKPPVRPTIQIPPSVSTYTHTFPEVQLPPMADLLAPERDGELTEDSDTPLPRLPTSGPRISPSPTTPILGVSSPASKAKPAFLYNPHRHLHYHTHHHHHHRHALLPPQPSLPLPQSQRIPFVAEHPLHESDPNTMHMRAPYPSEMGEGIIPPGMHPSAVHPSVVHPSVVHQSSAFGGTEKQPYSYRQDQCCHYHHHYHHQQPCSRGVMHSTDRDHIRYTAHHPGLVRSSIRARDQHAGVTNASFFSSVSTVHPTTLESHPLTSPHQNIPTNSENTYPRRSPARHSAPSVGPNYQSDNTFYTWD